MEITIYVQISQYSNWQPTWQTVAWDGKQECTSLSLHE